MASRQERAWWLRWDGTPPWLTEQRQARIVAWRRRAMYLSHIGPALTVLWIVLQVDRSGTVDSVERLFLILLAVVSCVSLFASGYAIAEERGNRRARSG